MLSRRFDNLLYTHSKTILLILCCCFFFLSCHDEASSPLFSVTSQESIPDNNLRTCINEAKNAQADANQPLTSLRCPNANIGNLAGLETLTALEIIDVSNNQIKNITPIFNLLDQIISYDNAGKPSTKPVLTTINLSNNQISNANKILTFSQPVDIDLSGNPLRNLPYPKNLRAIPTNAENIIRWQAIPQALSYNIYFKQNSQTESTHKLVTQWLDSRYVHTALTNDIPYFYQVSANFAAGESRISPAISATPTTTTATPLPPENVSLAAIAADQIMIDWAEVPHATSYTLRSAIAGNFPDIINILPPFRHRELSPETTYWYQLISINELGESLVTKEYSATTLQQTDIQPSNRVAFSATPEDGQITLSWAVITEQQSLYFSLEPYNDITTIKQSTTLLTEDNPPWLHKELTNNINYYYYLVSVTSNDITTFQRQTAKPNQQLTNLSFSDSNLSQCINDSGYTAVAELQALHCASYDIRSVSGIESLTALQELTLEHNAISDIRPIYSLTNLRKLSLYDNQLSNISGIDKLQQLKYLELRSNQINDLSPLITLDLIALGMGDNQIVNLTPLNNLNNLKNLDISNNSINNIEVLTQLGQLERLNISQNRITNVTVLAGLKQLVYLDIGNNTINDFAPLNKLPLLNFSNLIGNTDTPQVFVISGTVTGLAGSGLILQLENSEQLTIEKNGYFNFSSPFSGNSSYRVTISQQPQQLAQRCIVSNDSGVIGNADINTVNVTCETLLYNVNVSVSGLLGNGFEVQLGDQTLPISLDGTQPFPLPRQDGSDLQLSINQQPKQPLQICAISNEVIRIQSADVNFSIHCITEQFQISGNITGLQGKGLLLQNNNANDLSIDNDGNFAFSNLFDDNSNYQISIKKPPFSPSQTCKIEGGDGIIPSRPVTSINIFCEINQFNVGGSITGLLGNGLVLQNNGNDDLNINSDGNFRFQIPLLDMSDYRVTVKQNPSTPSQTCIVSAESGNLQGADVSSVVINCNPNKFTIGGTVQGLQGQGLVLQNQAANDLAISAEGNFTFANPITDQDSYAISVLQNPTNPVQTCEVSQNQNGQTQGRNVTAIQVSCTTEKYTIGGQITGLAGSGLIITNNNKDNLIIDIEGEFQFPTAIVDHGNYAISVLKNPINPVQTCTVSSNGIGQVNGDHLRDITITCVTQKFKVGGRVTGLMGKGLVVTNNENDNFTLDADGEFQFSIPITDGDSYQVSVTSQPSQPNQTCNVSGSNGIISGSDTNAVVVINCDTESYTVGGVLNGLLGSGLELQLNNQYTLTINQGSHFTFIPAIPDASEYQITILRQPSNLNQTCTINNSTGTIQGDNIATAEVNCQTNIYSINGTIQGLAGKGLILQNNEGDDLTVETDGNFTFINKIEDGNLYQVTVLQQPSQLSQTCIATNEQASGTVQGTDISSITIDCQTNSYSINGSVTGLAGTGLTLTSNTGDTLSINNNGEFTFDTRLLDGSDYQIAISQQPTALSQICSATNSEGKFQGADINNVTIDCQTNSYSISGSVTGLAGTGLTLTSNTGDTLSIENESEFIFVTPILDGSDYLVSVSQQPTALSQTCTTTNSEGEFQGADINNVTIDCQTNSYSIGGSITGLAGTGLTLTSSTGDTLSINDNGEFTFDTSLLDGSNYLVAVSGQPKALSQICTATNSEGDVQGANISSVTIDCQTNTFSISGTLSGLTGSGLILQINSTDDFPVTADGAFNFSTPLADGSDYALSVKSQPTEPNQTCSTSHATGRIDGADITDISLTCEDNNFITNVQLSPASPTSLSLNQRVLVKFEYETVHTDGVRIWSKPYAAGSVLPGLSFEVSPPPYAVGTGQGESFFTVIRAIEKIDEIRMEMRTVNTDILLREVILPVEYTINPAEHDITNMTFSIESPATLNYGTDVTVSYDYTTNDANGVIIWVTPLSNSDLSPRQQTSEPLAFPVGQGSGSATFTINNGAIEISVDQIRLQMFTKDQNFVLAEKFAPVDFLFQQAQTLNSTVNNFISNIRLLPATARNMTNNEPIRIDFNYDTIVSEGIIIKVQPISAEAPNLESYWCGIEAYPVGTGSGTCLITISQPLDMTINALHFTMITADQRAILYETSIFTAYTYAQNQTENVKRPVVRTKNQPHNNIPLSKIATAPFTVYPTDSAYNVFLNTMITIKPNSLKEFISLTPDNITLSNNTSSLPGQIDIKDDIITFKPANPLTSATNYTVTLNPADNHASPPYEWHFTTALLPYAEYAVISSTQKSLLPQTNSSPLLMLTANEKEVILKYKLKALPNKLSQASINFTLTTVNDQLTLFSIYAFSINHDIRSEPILFSSFRQSDNSPQRTSYSFPITRLLNKAKAQGDEAIGFRFAIIDGDNSVAIENSEPNKIPAIMPYIRYLP